MKYENMPIFTHIESDIDFSEFTKISNYHFELISADCKEQIFYIKSKEIEKDLNELTADEEKEINQLIDVFAGLKIIMIVLQSFELERIRDLGRSSYKAIRDIILKHKARKIIDDHKMWKCKRGDFLEFLEKGCVKVLKPYCKFVPSNAMGIRWVDGTKWHFTEIGYDALGFKSGSEKLFEKILMQEIQKWRLQDE